MPTALIVDDEPAANSLLAAVIRLRHYQADSALTGADALAYLDAHKPDVIFLDLMLPDANGFDLCRKIKSSRETCLIPVIVVSARLATENRGLSYELGALDYIAKPYTPQRIFDAIQQAEAWRREIDENGDRGSLAIGGDADALHLELARLRCLLLANSTLEAAEVSRLVTAIRALDRFVRDRDAARPTTTDFRADYNRDSNRLIFRFRGPDGLALPAALPIPEFHVFDACVPSASEEFRFECIKDL